MTQIALKHLFNKFEYFLLKRQRKFVLDSEESESSDDNEFLSKCTDKYVKGTNPNLESYFLLEDCNPRLLRGVFRPD